MNRLNLLLMYENRNEGKVTLSQTWSILLVAEGDGGPSRYG